MPRWLVLLMAFSLSAQVAPKYRVVQAEKVEWKPPIAAVNALADQGYRLLVPGPLFILRLESTTPDTYCYMAMKLTFVNDARSDYKYSPEQFLDWVNEQGGARISLGSGVGRDGERATPEELRVRECDPLREAFSFPLRRRSEAAVALISYRPRLSSRGISSLF